MARVEQLVIRRAVAEDAEGICLAHRAAVLAKAAQDYPPELIKEWVGTITEEKLIKLKGKILSPEYIVFVAVFDNEIVGFSEAFITEQELVACYTKPNPIGGVGKKLLQALESEVLALGCNVLKTDSSINAAPFYQKHGYILLEHGEHQLNSGAVMACAKMRKTLGDVD
jgi:hypothetical protein